MSSLSSSLSSPSEPTSPSSTQSHAGWGSPDIPNVPAPPSNHMELSMTPSIESPPILSINVSLHTHCLHKGMLKEDKKDTSHSLLYFPHIHHTLESHLDVNSPLWSVTQIYLQNQQLRTLLDLASFPSSIGRRCNALRIIQQTI